MNIWHKLGVSVALIAMFCGIVLKTFQDKSYYANYKWYFCGALLVAGVGLTFIGRSAAAARRARYLAQKDDEADRAPGDEPQEEIAEPSEPFLLANQAYWGVMLVVFGGITALVMPTYNKTPTVVAAREAQKTNAPAGTNAVVITNSAVAVPKAPTIKLQGIVFREPKSSVLINGRTYFVGDTFEDATLVQINPTNVVFEWKGQPILVHRPE